MSRLHNRKPWSSEPFSEVDDSERKSKEKIFYFALLVVLMFGILSLQLARMQLVNGEKYERRAQTNRLRLETLLPSRGLIYDSAGRPLVENVPSYAAAVVAADIPEGQETTISIHLQELTGVPAGQIVDKIMERQESNDPFTPAIIKDNLNQETAFRLREKLAELPGVRVVVEPKRRYLEGEMFSHIMGFVGPVYEEDYGALAPAGYQLNDRVGKAGIEYTYESLLRGAIGSQAVETDASGREINVLESSPATPGLNVVLSIDAELQRNVERILRDSMGASLNAAACIIDVNTGDILAMVSLPNYDSNLFSGDVNEAALQKIADHPGKPMLNHVISEMYPPGSTFKQITGLAALQEGVATASTQITSFGSIQVRNEFDPNIVYTFRDWRSDLGTMNFYRGLAMSSDVYFYYLAGGYSENGRQLFKGLGATERAEWSRRFGLGEPTGIDLPGESEGLVPDPTWKEETLGEGWLLGDSYNFGIGQGYVGATPLQMLLVTAAVANGGEVLVPHVVKELRDGEGNVIEISRQDTKRNLNVDQRNVDIMREAMRQAVADGSAFTAQVRNVQIAGKTGTAEFGELIGDRRYKEHGWFAGVAPFNNPEIAVVVFHEQGNGAGTAAPTAAKILD